MSIGKPAPKIHQWTIYFCRWGFGWVDKAQCFRSARRFGAAGSSPDFSRGFSRHGAPRPLSWTFFQCTLLSYPGQPSYSQNKENWSRNRTLLFIQKIKLRRNHDIYKLLSHFDSIFTVDTDGDAGLIRARELNKRADDKNAESKSERVHIFEYTYRHTRSTDGWCFSAGYVKNQSTKTGKNLNPERYFWRLSKNNFWRLFLNCKKAVDAKDHIYDREGQCVCRRSNSAIGRFTNLFFFFFFLVF